MESTHSKIEATKTSILDTTIKVTNNCLISNDVHSNIDINKHIKTLNNIMDENEATLKYKAVNLKILVVNFQSIRNKKEELALLLSEYDIDIVLGSETHLKENISDKEIMHPAYTCYRRDNDGYGGAIIIVKKALIVEEIRNAKSCQFVAVKIETHKYSTCFLGNCI